MPTVVFISLVLLGSKSDIAVVSFAEESKSLPTSGNFVNFEFFRAFWYPLFLLLPFLWGGENKEGEKFVSAVFLLIPETAAEILSLIFFMESSGEKSASIPRAIFVPGGLGIAAASWPNGDIQLDALFTVL